MAQKMRRQERNVSLYAEARFCVFFRIASILFADRRGGESEARTTGEGKRKDFSVLLGGGKNILSGRLPPPRLVVFHFVCGPGEDLEGKWEGLGVYQQLGRPKEAGHLGRQCGQ